eukprot:11327371-Prorocentrum_lima.AAC.1
MFEGVASSIQQGRSRRSISADECAHFFPPALDKELLSMATLALHLVACVDWRKIAWHIEFIGALL